MNFDEVGMEADMKQQPHVDLKRHHRLRAILIEHQNAVVTTVPRSALLSAAKRFGLAVGDRLLLECHRIRGDGRSNRAA